MWSGVLAFRLLAPSGNAYALSLAETETRARVAVQAQPSVQSQAEQYLEIVRERSGFKTVQELRSTLNQLMVASKDSSEFRKFCNGMFQCKEIMITSTTTPAQTSLLKTLEQDPAESLVRVYSTSSNKTRTKVVKGRMRVEEAYANITRSGETKPAYVTPQLASLLGIKAGWVLFVVGTEDSVKRSRSGQVADFSIRIMVMHL